MIPGSYEFTKEIDPNFDLEIGIDLADCKQRRGKDIIIVPADLMEEKINTDEMVNSKVIMKWINKFRSVFMFLLIIIILGLTLRTVFLEIKVNSYPSQIHRLNREINELHKSNVVWEELYNE